MHSNRVTALAAAILAMVGLVSAAIADEPAKTLPFPKGKQVSGTVQIGDKTYKLEHIVAYKSKVFDEERPSLLFSDKPIDVKKLQAAIQKDGTDDSFSTFQTHVKVTFDETGKPSFCNAYGDNNSLSVSGGRLEGELKVENGVAQGKTSLAQDPESKRKGNFSVQFNAPLLKIPATAPKTDTARTAASPATSNKSGKVKAEREPKPATSLQAVSVFDLPMPKDAKDIERKELVGHIKYTSANSVKSVVNLLQKKLAEQGWQTEDEDFNAPASSILHRKRGEANLTIFVKPTTPGCTVTIMSEGLNWDQPTAE